MVVVDGIGLKKVNLNTKLITPVYIGTEYTSEYLTLWAKGLSSYAFCLTNILIILNSQFEEINKFEFQDRILHVLWLFNDNYLILTQKEVFLVDVDLKCKNVIDIKTNQLEIYSGAAFGSSHFILHVKIYQSTYQTRVYDLYGNMISSKNSQVGKRYF